MGSENDRRVLLAIALIMVVYYVWVAFINPPPPAVAPAGPVAEQGAEPVERPVAANPSAGVLPEAVQSQAVPPRAEPYQGISFRGVISSAGGTIGAVQLDDYVTSPTTTAWWTWAIARLSGGTSEGWKAYQGGGEPRQVLDPQGSVGLAGVGPIGSDGGYLLEGGGDRWTTTRVDASGLIIRKRISPGETPHTLQVEVEFDNSAGPAVDQVWVGVVDEMSGAAGRFDNASRPQAYVDESIEHLLDLSDVAGGEAERFDGPVSWFGVGDRYFMSALALQDPLIASVVFDLLPDGRGGAFLVDGQGLDAGARRSYRFVAWMGPKDLDLLQKVGYQLDEAVEFGFFGFFSRMLLFLLKVAQKGVVNWGLAILALTLLVKAVFYPLTQKAFTSSKRMQAIQPMMKAIQEKYKDNKELASVETMKLFKDQGVNPMGGCLPSLVQMPVWFALYGVMLNSVELYNSKFLYLNDLTAADPYGLLPVIYAVLIFIQQQMMPMTGLDPAQQKMMKLLPIVFAAFMFTFPSGLVLYFCANILLTILQQWLINRTFDSQPQTQAAAT